MVLALVGLSILGGFAGLYWQLRACVKRVERRLIRHLQEASSDLAAAHSVTSSLDLRAPLPPFLGGYSISGAAGSALTRFILERNIQTVVELGSGLSSLLIGYTMQRRGSGHLYSVEHLSEYAEKSRALVAAHGLSDYVTVVHAPLVDIGDGARWYDASALDSLASVDLLFVDGPPGKTCPQSRYPALPTLHSKLSPSAAVVLDDMDRGEERAIFDRWMKEYPEFCRGDLHVSRLGLLTR